MAVHLNRGTFQLHAHAGMHAGEPLSQRAYRVPGYPGGVGRTEIGSLSEEGQQDVLIFWFRSNFRPMESPGIGGYGTAGAPFAYALDPLNALGLEFRNAPSPSAVVAAGRVIMRFAPLWEPIPEPPPEDAPINPDALTDDAAFRAEMLRQFATIRCEVAALREVQRHGPGGNNPPDAVPMAAAEEADLACAAMATTLAETTPDTTAATTWALNLRTSAETLGRWSLQIIGGTVKGAITIDGAKLLAPEVMPLVISLYHHLMAASELIDQWVWMVTHSLGL